MEIILDVLLETAIIGPIVFIALVAIWKLFIKKSVLQTDNKTDNGSSE